jgi:hypothetical protein
MSKKQKMEKLRKEFGMRTCECGNQVFSFSEDLEIVCSKCGLVQNLKK